MAKSKVKVPTTTLPFYKNRKIQFIIISVFTFFLYSGIINYQFIGLDEPTLIIDNYMFLKNPSNIPQAFNQHVFYSKHHTDNPKDYYRPVLTLSFMIDAQFSAHPQPKYYHFFNIVYHLIACLLLFVLFHRLKVDSQAAFILTLIFSAHPLLSQAVAWVPGRNDSLITIFCLLSFIQLITYAEAGLFKNAIWHFLFFAISMFTKESAIALTLVSFYFLLFIQKKKIFSKEIIVMVTGYAAVITIWYFMRNAAFKGSSAESIQNPVGEFISNMPLLLQYFQKIILPFNLSVMSVVADINYPLCIVALLIFIALIYFSKEKHRAITVFGLLWYVVFIAPSFITSYFGGLEHRVYLPMIGIFIVLAHVDFFKHSAAPKKYKYLSPIVLIFFSGLTLYRLPVFSNMLNYYKSAVETSDHSSLACLNLGKTYESMGQYTKAIEAYTEGLKRNPNEHLLHNNIGGALIFLKRDSEAKVELKKEIELFPKSYLAWYNLGLAENHLGNFGESVLCWKKAIQYNKNFRDPYQQLVEHYLSIKDSVNAQKYKTEMMEIVF